MSNSMTRRDFLKAGPLTLAAIPSLISQPSIKVYHIPVQDSCLKKLLAEQVADTLKALADTGFKELAHTGDTNTTYYGLSPREFRKKLDDSPITLPVGQARFRQAHWLPAQKEVSDAWKKMVENALTVGQEYLFTSGFDWDIHNSDEIKKGVDALNRVGERMEESGLRLGFCPTDREFTTQFQGRPVYEYLLKHMDSLYVSHQLHLNQLARLGQSPVTWLRQSPHHFESLLVQDYAGNPSAAPALGSGTLPLDEILAFARKNNPIKYWTIQVAPPTTERPWRALGNDLQRFRQYGFV